MPRPHRRSNKIFALKYFASCVLAAVMAVETRRLFLSSFMSLAFICVGDVFDLPETHDPHPQLLSTPVVIHAAIGDSVTFPCEVDDLGDYVLLWKTGKRQILFALPVKVTRNERFHITGDTSLRISGVMPEDSGEYVCQISTFPPLEVTHILNVQNPPEIEVHIEHLYTAEGTTAELNCTVRGNPPPSVTWKQGDRVLFPSKKYHLNTVGETHVLQIHDMREDNFGRYECSAHNTLNSDSAIIYVTEEIPDGAGTDRFSSSCLAAFLGTVAEFAALKILLQF